MTPEEIKRRAEHAAQLLNDSLLVETLDTIEREIIEQWEQIPERDTEGREIVWRYYKLAKKFRALLQGALESGTVTRFHEQKPQSLVQKTVAKVSRFANITRR